MPVMDLQRLTSAEAFHPICIPGMTSMRQVLLQYNLLAGGYGVIVMDSQLCTTADSVYVEAGLEMCPVEDSLNIPSSFTPNGDLTNDTWILRGIDKFPGMAVDIYSRWGSLLYNST